jgi:hypothetical protein
LSIKKSLRAASLRNDVRCQHSHVAFAYRTIVGNRTETGTGTNTPGCWGSMASEGDIDTAASASGTTEDPDSGEVIGSAALRPVFLGNLVPNYSTDEVTTLFERPMLPAAAAEGAYRSIPVDRIDLKRGYCFVFLKDAATQADKEQAERFVSDINGM